MRIQGLIVGVILGAAVDASAAEHAATTPGPIRGCYAKRGGALRVPASSKATCRSTERAIAWNAAGPRGSAGQGLSFARENASTGTVGYTLLSGVRSGPVAGGGTYTISGSVSNPCVTTPPGATIEHYNVEIAVLKTGAAGNVTLDTAAQWPPYPAAICGSTIRVPPSAVAAATGDTLMVVVNGTLANGSPFWPTSLSFELRGATDQEL